jgi:uncharacterized membrane protein
MNPLQIALRWTHVAAVIVFVGGAFFLRVVFLPLAARLAAEPAQQLRAAVARRWSFVARACMVLIIGSGIYNFVVVGYPRHAGQMSYNALFGLKVALALAAFGIVEGPVRKDPARWLTVNLLLAIALIAISSTLKFLPAN